MTGSIFIVIYCLQSHYLVATGKSKIKQSCHTCSIHTESNYCENNKNLSNSIVQIECVWHARVLTVSMIV